MHDIFYVGFMDDINRPSLFCCLLVFYNVMKLDFGFIAFISF